MFELYGLLAFCVSVFLTRPGYFRIIPQLLGFHETTFLAQDGLKSVSESIENAVINSAPQSFNSILTLSPPRIETGSGPQYRMGNNVLLRWYCTCHGLKTITKSWPCFKEGFGLLYLSYHPAKATTFQPTIVTPASWSLRGLHSTRAVFLKAMGKPQGGLGSIRLYLPQGPLRRKSTPWKEAADSPVRDAKTLVLDGGLRSAIFNRIERFIKTEPRYLEKGLPAQLGILLLGPMGTGKSTLVHVVAREFNFPVYDFNLTDVDLDDSDLMALCDTMQPNSIAVFDDIDRVNESGRKISPSVLMKAFDGVKMRNQGRLLFATANDRTKIPESLLRKGRIDIEYKFGMASKAQLRELFLQTNVWSDEEKADHDLDALADKFSDGVSSGKYPPSAISSYLHETIGPCEAIKNVANIGATLEREEGGREGRDPTEGNVVHDL